MEEMQTKEKQIVYDQALYEKPMNLQKETWNPEKNRWGSVYHAPGGGSQDSEKRRL